MKVDFSLSIEYWINLIRDFFNAIQKFFEALGVVIFANNTPAPESETTEPETSV